MMATSQVRQNYHAESEEGINKQINSEFFAMYSYMSMVSCTLTYQLGITYIKGISAI